MDVILEKAGPGKWGAIRKWVFYEIGRYLQRYHLKWKSYQNGRYLKVALNENYKRNRMENLRHFNKTTEL